MQTLRDIAPYVALASAALSLALLVLVAVLAVRVRRLRRAQTVVLGHHDERDIVSHVNDLDAQVRNLREAVEILTDQLDAQKRHLDHALTNRAIIRYDAFRDAGGEQSASFALLDQYRSGVVFSAIAARDFARIYVKHLQEGVADRDLSPEEVKAVAAAVPRPLRAGEEGPRAARAPLPESAPPGGLSEEGTPNDEPAAAQPAVPEEAAAAFEALREAVEPGSSPGAPTTPPADEPAPGDADDFTWDPPPARPPRD
jgi:hypothetical protein